MAGPRPADTRLAQTLVELTDCLVEDFDVVDLMVLLTERCVELLDTAAAGLLLADSDGTLHLMAATSEATEAVELFQIQSDEGPCRDCFHLGRSVTTLNLEDENVRWPRFAPVAAAAGFRAAHAFPLRLRGRVLGAMNLFRTEPFALSESDIATAQALADVATIAVLQSRSANDAQTVADHMQEALQTRITIEQAKGIVAQRAGETPDQAFARLRLYARRSSTRLGEVAQQVVDGSLALDA